MANLDTAYSLPDGYKSAIKANLSVRLWPFYKQGDPPAWLIELASQTLANIKRTNLKQSEAQYDSAVTNTAARGYNIQNDS